MNFNFFLAFPGEGMGGAGNPLVQRTQNFKILPQEELALQLVIAILAKIEIYLILIHITHTYIHIYPRRTLCSEKRILCR